MPGARHEPFVTDEKTWRGVDTPLHCVSVPAVLGGYQLLERIAAGGMAEVFLAHKAGPEGWQKRVALKRILPHLSHQPDFVTRFLDEAQLAARLCHANVVQVYDFGVDGDVYYLAMEYVDGEPLEALIRRAAELAQPPSLSEAVTLLLGACAGLHHVHEQGIIHRDVTPSNLLLSWDGVVKLTDFGIAKLEARATQTQTGALNGKIAYMSPEQALAQPLDRRTDIYSLGVCAWELLTLGRLRSAPNELALLESVQNDKVPRVSTLRPIPAALESVLARALARSPDERFATARAFGEALAGWLARTGAVPSTGRLARRMRDYFGGPRTAPLLPTEPTAPNTLRRSPPAVAAAARRDLRAWARIPFLPLAVQLQLPPLKLPRLRLLLPLLAILLSGRRAAVRAALAPREGTPSGGKVR